MRERARTEPLWFCRNVLRLRDFEPTASPEESWELDSWAEEMIESVFDVWRKRRGIPTKFNHEGKTNISVRAMHGPGKTFTAAGLMHVFRFAFPATIVCTAPKFKQVATRLWPAFRKIRGRAIPQYRLLIEVSDTRVRWLGADGDWDREHFAFIETAQQPDNMQGIHDKYLLIIVDEPTGVPEDLWPVIFGALSTGVLPILVMIGNPIRITGTFADSHLKPAVSQDYHCIHVKLENTRRVSRLWVEKMIRKYGPKSPVVLSRCFGEFPLSEENQLMALAWLELARGREFPEHGDGTIPRGRISIDVADGGENLTVFTVSLRYEQMVRLRKQKTASYDLPTATDECIREAEELFRHYDFRKEWDEFVVDSLGVGTGVASGLITKGYRVVRHKGGVASTDPTKWRNARSQCHLAARDDYRAGRVYIDEDFVEDELEWGEFCAQVCAVQMDHGRHERVEDIETREKLLDRLGFSPDRGDSHFMNWSRVRPEMPALAADQPAFLTVPSAGSRSYDASLTS